MAKPDGASKVEPAMAKVTIDGVDYDSETMMQDSRQKLEMLMMTEQKIRQLQAEVTMMQTAR
jgi:hypothetical protein